MEDRRTNIENKMTVAPQAGGADGGSISLTLLDQNLNALSEVDESPAARLRLVRVEDHFTPAVGRDGHATLRRRLADGSAIWHGRTSMPTISGPALLEQFEVGSGNVAFEGIGHGREAVLLLERFASHQVLFILEPDPVAMVGALLLNDFSEAIRRRRLLLIVQPDTLVGWHRQGFRLYWRWKSRAVKAGHPRIEAEIRKLIRRMSLENPTWGKPRIRSELRLLGYTVAKSTVDKYGDFGGHTDSTNLGFIQHVIAPLIMREGPRHLHVHPQGSAGMRSG